MAEQIVFQHARGLTAEVIVHPAVERPAAGAFRSPDSGQALLQHPERTA